MMQRLLWNLVSVGLLSAAVLLVGMNEMPGQTKSEAPARTTPIPKPYPSVAGNPASPEEAKAIQAKLTQLQAAIAELKKKPDLADTLLADVEIHAKAADWILRHNEFYKPDYVAQTLAALDAGLQRAAELAQGKSPWEQAPGRSIRGYRSIVDESVQPYAVTLPAAHGKEPEKRWPLHLVLHGRGGTLNEVRFIATHAGKPPGADQDWIQLDVFGRTDNAYRWSGETDVMEALADVRRRFRIDEKRVVLHGFSMGGAGSWHLGLHYPSLWCSVGPGAGFIDFYKYQKVDQELPFYQHEALHIYDAPEYVLNAFNVPFCTYGGEKDEQLVASTSMVEAAKKLDVPMKMILGLGVGHAFTPEGFKEFMAFHHEQQVKGRPTFPGPEKIRFVTYTLKYNTCDWVTIEEIMRQYRPATVEAERDATSGRLIVKTENVAVLQIARDVAEEVEIDGSRLPLTQAAGGLLPGVYYENNSGKWDVVNYDSSRNFQKNIELRKRHNLQGPIDDAFMGPFVCVKGTGVAWSQPQADWANWTLDRFSAEFDKWFRGKVVVLNDSEITPDIMLDKNLILFGDPGSNSVLAQVLARLPIKWTKEGLLVNGEKYDPATHGLSMIYPNPLSPRRYIVINSGHTIHERDFKASNAWLFPRLGDIAIQKFEKQEQGGYTETTVWADFFNNSWKLPSGLAPKVAAQATDK